MSPWELDPIVLTVLQAAGWSPTRSTGTARWIEELESEGYSIFEYARAVMSAFGDLRLEPVENEQAAFASGPLDIGPVVGERDRVVEWSELLAVPLVPVGEWMDYYFVVVARDMRVFAGALGQLLYLGPTFEVALEVVVKANRPPEEVALG